MPFFFCLGTLPLFSAGELLLPTSLEDELLLHPHTFWAKASLLQTLVTSSLTYQVNWARPHSQLEAFSSKACHVKCATSDLHPSSSPLNKLSYVTQAGLKFMILLPQLLSAGWSS